MRTRNKLFAGCEVTPDMKSRIKQYADSKGLSEAQVIRNILNMVFFNIDGYMEGNGSIRKEEESKNE